MVEAQNFLEAVKLFYAGISHTLANDILPSLLEEFKSNNNLKCKCKFETLHSGRLIGSSLCCSCIIIQRILLRDAFSMRTAAQTCVPCLVQQNAWTSICMAIADFGHALAMEENPGFILMCRNPDTEEVDGVSAIQTHLQSQKGKSF